MTAAVASRSDTISALKCELAAEALHLSGRLRLQVNGWSMLPSILPGDTLTIESARAEQVSPGEIVLFQRDRRLFAHRVVAKANDRRILTQGDGRAWPDPAVDESELLGRVSFIVREGRLMQPGKTLGLSQRAVAAVVRRSPSAARLVAGIHGMRRSHSESGHPCHT